MSGAASGSALMYVGAGLAAGALMSSMQNTPNIPSPQAPTTPPQSQAAQTPDANAFKGAALGAGQAGGAPGIAQTFLTGAGGVNPNQLLLGKNTLLGG